MHKDYVCKHVDNSKLWRNKAEDTKRSLWLCQATFAECINRAQAATTASYKIREILPKTITFAGSNMLKVR